MHARSFLVLRREQPGRGPKRHREREHNAQAASFPEVSPLGQAGKKLKASMRRKPVSEASCRQQSEVGSVEELLGFGSRATRRRHRALTPAPCGKPSVLQAEKVKQQHGECPGRVLHLPLGQKHRDPSPKRPVP